MDNPTKSKKVQPAMHYYYCPIYEVFHRILSCEKIVVVLHVQYNPMGPTLVFLPRRVLHWLLTIPQCRATPQNTDADAIA